jgi:hypothetical protein
VHDVSILDDDARARWAEFRRAPFRRDVLPPLIARCDAARRDAAANLVADPAALAELLAAAVVGDHLRRVQSLPLVPSMVALLVAADMLAPDDAVALLDLRSADERAFVATIVPRLAPAALWPLLERLLAAPALMAHFDALTPALRRAAALDGPRTVALLRSADRAPHLAALLPHLDGDARAAARSHVLSHLSRRTGLFDQLELLSRALPALTDADLAPLRRRLDLPDLAALPDWLAPRLRAEWDRLDAVRGARARLDAWESRLDAIGPLLTADDARRWLAALVFALVDDPQQAFRLQVGIPRELADEAADLLESRLSAPILCDALVWLARPHGGRIAARAMRTILATELPDAERRHLLGALLPVLPPPERRRAAATILADPERTTADELRAAAYLEGDRLRAAAQQLLDAAPLAAPRPSPALSPALAVAPLAALAAQLAGDDRDAVLSAAWALAAQLDRGARWTSLRALAPLIAPADAARLAESVLAEPSLPPQARAAMLALLPDDRVLPHLRAAADDVPPTVDRWHVLGELAGDRPDGGALLRRLYREREQAGALAPDEVVAFPPWARDVALWRAYAEHMRAHPWRPYAGWLLGAAARELPEQERGPVLDAALAEFAAIVATPTSPGNDDGPFVDLADLLSEPQVRRALELCARMQPHGWGGDLERSRLHLHLRLAALGRVDEAAAAIAAIDRPDLRAWATGALAGVRLSRGAAWSTARPDAPADPEHRYNTLAGLLWALGEPASPVPEDIIAGALALLPGVDPELLNPAVRELARLRIDPPRWADVVRAHATGDVRVALLLDLAERTTSQPLAAEALAFAESDALDPDDIIADVLRAHALLPPAVLARWLTRWLAAGRSLSELHELPFAPALRTLGGPAAVRAAADALVGVADLLT